ncbi:MAG: patatin-like phospholipase family protein [Lacipirellulaceae bacterium]
MGDDRHAHIETITDFNEHLELKLRDQSIDGYIAQLKSTFPNARDQEEFASYIGSEVPDLGVGSRSTSAYPGALPYLATSSEAERNGIVGRGKPNSSQKESSKKRGHDVSLSKQRLVVRQAVLKGCLKSLDQASIELVDSEASVDVNGLDEREIYRAIEQERMRRSLRQRKTLELEILAKEIDVSEGGAALARAARNEIVTRALSSSPGNRQALRVLADLSNPRVPSSGDLTERMKIYVRRPATIFDFDELVTIAMAKFCVPTGETNSLNPANQVVVMVGSGLFGDLEDVKEIRRELSEQSYPIKHRILLLCSSMLFTLAYCFFDFNATSIHGYYRDRLSEAFLMKTKPGVGPEIDVRLSELSQLGSTGPYLLVNTAINLQNSKDLALRSTRSDFFIFSKLYCGGSRTGYVTTNIMEKAYSRVRLNTAVAVSAAAVSPNMGRFTNGFIVMLMTFLNVRLGYWVPNPAALLQNAKTNNRFPEVFRQELLQVVIPRWSTLNSIDETRSGDTRQTSESIDFRETVPRAQYGLVGLAFSGGGIRSASLCLGIAQILNSKGVFRHVDYLSTVSGGGFIGSGIVAAMRLSEDLSSNLDDAVTEQKMNAERAYSVETEEVRHTKPWRLPIFNLIREATSRLDENGPWVNLSDGGHIENLGVIELLRRRCRFIFACDGEADPRYQFNGLATVQRLAKIELGIEIEIDTEEIRPDDQGVSSRHWVIGKIHYPERDEMDREQGYLLYLKASYSGDEALTVREYRASNPDFPHEPTSDQFFDVRQFEAYRVLGAHLARSATNALEETNKGRLDTYEGFSNAFTALAGEGSAAS